MKSIQTKVSLAITVVMLLATGTLMVTAMLRNRNMLNSESDKVVMSSADYYALVINNCIRSCEENEGEIDLDTLRDETSKISVYGMGSALVMTRDGDVIYQQNYKNGMLLKDMTPAEQEHFRTVLSLERGTAQWHDCLDGQPSKIVVKDLDNGMIFGVSIPRVQIARPQIRLVIQLFFRSIVIVILAIVIGLLWVRSIIKPLKKMTDAADRYANGDYSGEMMVESKDEVGRLSGSLQTMAESLRRQIEIADTANQAKSNFLSNMSHEIRTPITAVLGFNEMILREADDPEILQYAENIRTSGNTLLGLINDILDFSKIEAGKIEITPVDYDTESMIGDLVNMIKARAEEKGLELRLDLDKDMPGKLNGDEVRIKQIITNILTNAVKYTEKGSVTFTVGCTKADSDPDSVMLNVAVKDTGVGIRKEDIQKIFIEFERLDEKNNRNIEGTGLGMSITRSLLEMMGSSLKVESVYGEGSVFSFSLKQKVVSWTPVGVQKKADVSEKAKREKYKSAFTAKEARVLMVDDNSTNLLLYKKLMKQTLVKVDTALSGDECLKLCKEAKYDIIFLDHMMPGKDGIETLHELRADAASTNADTPVICLTANAISGAREEYLGEGFNDYLAKPIEPKKLEEAMLEYLPKEKIDRVPDGV